MCSIMDEIKFEYHINELTQGIPTPTVLLRLQRSYSTTPDSWNTLPENIRIANINSTLAQDMLPESISRWDGSVCSTRDTVPCIIVLVRAAGEREATGSPCHLETTAWRYASGDVSVISAVIQNHNIVWNVSALGVAQAAWLIYSLITAVLISISQGGQLQFYSTSTVHKNTL